MQVVDRTSRRQILQAVAEDAALLVIVQRVQGQGQHAGVHDLVAVVDFCAGKDGDFVGGGADAGGCAHSLGEFDSHFGIDELAGTIPFDLHYYRIGRISIHSSESEDNLLLIVAA